MLGRDLPFLEIQWPMEWWSIGVMNCWKLQNTNELQLTKFKKTNGNFPAASGINSHFKPWPRPGFERSVSKKANYEFFLKPTSTPSVSHQGRL